MAWLLLLGICLVRWSGYVLADERLLDLRVGWAVVLVSIVMGWGLTFPYIAPSIVVWLQYLLGHF
jgi:hypothetical protein